MIFIVNALSIGLWFFIIKKLDIHRAYKKSIPFLVIFLFSGIVSVIPTKILYAMSPVNYMICSNDAFIQLAMHVLLVGPIEEFSKFILFFLVAVKFKTIKEPIDGILQGISVALGFAAIENLVYGSIYGLDTLLYRSILSTIGHLIYGAIWGFYLAIVMYDEIKKNGKPNYGIAFIALIPAAFFHGMSNFLIVLNWWWQALLFDAFTLLIAVIMFHYQIKRSPFKKYSIEQHKIAIPVLVKGIKNFKDNPVLYTRLAKFYLYTKNYKNAANVYAAVRKLDKENLYLKTLHAMSHWIATGEKKSRNILIYSYNQLSQERKKLFKTIVKKIIQDEIIQDKILNCI